MGLVTRSRAVWQLAAALSVVVLVAATACGSSGKSTSEGASSTTQAAPAKPLTSAVYPYSIALPEGWFPTFGQTQWDATTKLSSDSPAFDYYLDGTRQLFIGGAALSGQPSLEQWRDTVTAAAPSSCTNNGSYQQSSLDGESALVWRETCNQGGEALIKLAAIHRSRGYVFGLLSPARLNQDAERHLFDSARQSFHFTA